MVDEKTGEQGGPIEVKPFEGIQKAIAERLSDLREGFRSGDVSADEVAKEAELLSKQSEILGKLAREERRRPKPTT